MTMENREQQPLLDVRIAIRPVGGQTEYIKLVSRLESGEKRTVSLGISPPRKMSLEEKVGQLISVGVNATFLNQDSDAFRSLKHQIEDNKVGGVILFRGPVYESVI